MSLLLRALAMVSPRMALERQQALTVLRGYDAAQNGRRTGSFRPGAGSANSEISRALPVLRDRSRELVRNTFLGARTLDVLSTHIVTPDLSVRFDTGSASVDRVVQGLWDEWATACDIEEETGFTGLIELMVRAELEGGDSILRMIDLKLNDRRPVPLALHVGEGDLIDESRDSSLGNTAGTRTRLGVSLGPNDRRLGYWLRHSDAADDVSLGEPLSRLVAREHVCHLYRRLRPGQVRGLPVFAPVLMTGRDYGDLIDAVIVKARMEASIGLIVKRESSFGGLAAEVQKGADHTAITSLRPGMVEYVRPGEDVVPFVPAGNTAFDPISRSALMGFASGVGLTYHQLTGDLSKANYSSLKAGLTDFRKQVASQQWHSLVPQVIDRVVGRFIDRAILAGRLRPRAQGYRRRYVMPAFEPVDPKKDLEADILAVRAGRMSPQDFIGAWGRDWREVLREYSAFLEATDKAGLIFDIDARQRTRTGQETGQDSDADAASAANSEDTA